MLCVLSRVYLRIQGGEGVAEPTGDAMHCPGNPDPQTWLWTRRRQGWKSQRPQSHGPASPPQWNRLSSKAASLQMRAPACSLCGDQSRRPRRGPRRRGAGSRSRAEAVSSRWEPAPSRAPEHWMTMLQRPKGTRTSLGAASPQSGGAVQSLEDTPEAREAHGHTDRACGQASYFVNTAKAAFQAASLSPEASRGALGTGEAAYSQRGSAGCVPKACSRGGRGRWLSRPVALRTLVASQNRSEVRTDLCSR